MTGFGPFVWPQFFFSQVIVTCFPFYHFYFIHEIRKKVYPQWKKACLQIFSFWAQYGQNALSTPITMYKTDLPTLPIFGQHLRVFPYLIHIRSSHSGWQVWYMSWPRYESESSQQNTMQCVTPTAVGVLHLWPCLSVVDSRNIDTSLYLYCYFG